MASPIEIHDRAPVGQANILLDEAAMLQLHRIRTTETMGHEHHAMRRHHLGNSAPLALIEHWAHRSSTVEKLAALGENVSQPCNRDIRIAVLHKQPGLLARFAHC